MKTRFAGLQRDRLDALVDGGDGARRLGRVWPATNSGSTTMGPRVRLAPTGLSTRPDRRTLRAGSARAPG